MYKDLNEILENVYGICEATDFERLALWSEFHESMGYSWIPNNSGVLPTIGEIDNRPVCISLYSVIVCGKKILFWHATSQVVDYQMIEDWFKENIPQTAWKNGRMNCTDAMNFVNVLH